MHLLAVLSNNPRALGIEEDDQDAEGEVLEGLAHTEDVWRQGIVEQEVLDLPLDIATLLKVNSIISRY